MLNVNDYHYPQIPLSRYGDAQPGAKAPQRWGKEGGSWPHRRPAEKLPRREGGWAPSLAGHAGESYKFSALHKPAHQKGALHTRGYCWLLRFLYRCWFHSYKAVRKKFLCPEFVCCFSLWEKCSEADTDSHLWTFLFCLCLSRSVSFRSFRTGSLWRRCWTGFSCGPSSQCQYWGLSLSSLLLCRCTSAHLDQHRQSHEQVPTVLMLIYL